MSKSSRLPAKIGPLLSAVLEGEGRTPASSRRAIADRSATLTGLAPDGAHVPELVRRYTDKVAQEAYKLVDEDVAALREAGYSEDQIFEFTLAAAVGAALARFQGGLDLLNR